MSSLIKAYTHAMPTHTQSLAEESEVVFATTQAWEVFGKIQRKLELMNCHQGRAAAWTGNLIQQVHAARPKAAQKRRLAESLFLLSSGPARTGSRAAPRRDSHGRSRYYALLQRGGALHLVRALSAFSTKVKCAVRCTQVRGQGPPCTTALPARSRPEGTAGTAAAAALRAPVRH